MTDKDLARLLELRTSMFNLDSTSKEEREEYDSLLEKINGKCKKSNLFDEAVNNADKTIEDYISNYHKLEQENKTLKATIQKVEKFFNSISANHNASTIYHGFEKILSEVKK